MGLKFIDSWSFGHLGGGVLFQTVLSYIHISDTNNFLISNLFHLIIELLEKNQTPYGELLESNINHVGDILFFFFGWCISYLLNIHEKFDKYMIGIFAFIVVLFSSNEIYREIYPHNTSIFQGAYVDYTKKQLLLRFL
jgi:hypothetical protein